MHSTNCVVHNVGYIVIKLFKMLIIDDEMTEIQHIQPRQSC